MHTGFWGCGAFGGDRTLMALLQLVAARLAGLARVVFHTADARARPSSAARLRCTIRPGDTPIAVTPPALGRLVDDLVARGFRWGESDGN